MESLKKHHSIIIWVLLVVTLLLLIYPLIYVTPALLYDSAGTDVNSSTYGYDLYSNMETYVNETDFDSYSSEHFNYYAPVGYMTAEEMDVYMNHAENSCDSILRFLDLESTVSFDSKFDIYLIDSDGISYCSETYMVIYDYKSGLDHTVHEMVHAIDFALFSMWMEKGEEPHPDIISNFFWEQKAVFAEEVIGPGFAFPNFALPVNAYVYAQYRDDTLETLVDLNSMEGLMDSDIEASMTRYLIAGSFGRYLYETYGPDHYKEFYLHGYEGATGKTLQSLETEWLEWVDEGAFSHNLIYVAISLFTLGVLSYCLFSLGEKKKRTITLMIFSVLTYITWGYYLVYNGIETLWILAALLTALVLRKIKPAAAIGSLWFIGIASLILL